LGSVCAYSKPVFLTTVPQVIEPGMLPTWDYILRNILVQKGQHIERIIMFVSDVSASPPTLTPLSRNIGPGAHSLLPKLNDPSLPEEARIPPQAKANNFTIPQWQNFIRVFDEWPFKPEACRCRFYLDAPNLCLPLNRTCPLMLVSPPSVTASKPGGETSRSTHHHSITWTV